MSTGPEHYRDAEELLNSGLAKYLAAAQVHATLALVAVLANTKTSPEFPLAEAPSGYSADHGSPLTWKDALG